MERKTVQLRLAVLQLLALLALALCQAVRSGRIAGVALDAYEPEPAGADHPLVRLAAEFPDRIILCPHQGGVSQAAFRNAVRMVFENLDHILAGERPERVINGL